MPPEQTVVFFLDASIGSHVVANALRVAGEHVIVHDDLFPPGTRDEVWLAEAGKQNWVVLTKDKQIRHRGVELEALSQARVGAFVLVGKDLRGEQMAAALVSALPRMRRILLGIARPFVATIGSRGNVRLLKL